MFVEVVHVLASTPGTASFAFPMALVSKHGSYGVHKDERDISRTFWLVLGEAGINIVFQIPEYGVSVKLAHGGIVAFDGKALRHAATSDPNPPKQHRRIIVALYYQSQQDFKRYAQVLPSPNDSVMHGHAYIGHGPQCVERLGPARSRGCRGGEAGQMGRAPAVRPAA